MNEHTHSASPAHAELSPAAARGGGGGGSPPGQVGAPSGEGQAGSPGQGGGHGGPVPGPGVYGPYPGAGVQGHAAPGPWGAGAPHPGPWGVPPGMPDPGQPMGPPPHPGAHGPHPYGLGYPGWPPAMGFAPPSAQASGQGHGPPPGHGPGMAEVVQELAAGGSGLGSLGRLLNFEDSEFWKGALVGAAVVLLVTNDSLQNALFKGGVKAKDAVAKGVDGIKARAEAARASTQDTPDE